MDFIKYSVPQKIAHNLFNLAFGDWDEEKQIINDETRSNNGDRTKIIETVASTVYDFFKQYPHATLLIKGSTMARTRLFQIVIANKLEEIVPLFEIEGFYNAKWELFRKGINYHGFLIKKKVNLKFDIEKRLGQKLKVKRKSFLRFWRV